MAASAFKDNEILRPVDFIDEQPVWADMTFPAALPIAHKVVVFKAWGQMLSGHELGQYLF